MKKKIAVFLAVMFTFHAFLAAASYEEGLQFLRLANKARAMGNDADERTYLEKAYEQFRPSDERKSRLLGIHTGLRLSKQAEIDEIAVALVKENRRTYRTIADDLELVNQNAKEDIVRHLERTESRIPFIDDLGIEKETIYPFRGDQPGITFRLNAPAEVSLSVNGQSFRSDRLPRSGMNTLGISWKEDYLIRQTLDLGLVATGEIGSVDAEARVQMTPVMPANLTFDAQAFGIMGKNRRPETKEVKRPQAKHLVAALLWSGLTAGSYYAAIKATSEDASDTYTAAIVVCGLAAIYQLGRFISNPKKMTVDDYVNISYNRNLEAEIEAKKKDIAVKLQIEEKK